MKEQSMFFNLSEPLEFSKKGEFETTLSLEIEAPSPKNYDSVMALAQKVIKAMFEAQRSFSDLANTEQPEADQAPELDAKTVRMMLLSASVPMVEYVGPLAKLLETTCTLDGETRMTAPLFDKLGIVDKNNLLCEYVATFIVPLAL